jgi:hypothetical protein
VTDLVPTLPRELDAWFARAFAKKPADRFPDARSMARALSAIVPPIRSSMAPDEPPVSSRSMASERPAPEPLSERPVSAEPLSSENTETLGTLTVTAPPAKKHGRFLAAGAAIAAMMVVGFLVGRRERSAAAAVDERPEAPIEAVAPAPSPSAQTFAAPVPTPIATPPASSASSQPTASPPPAKTAAPKPFRPVKKSGSAPYTFDDIE